jgi:cytochrome c oxidase subunit II
MASRTRLIRRLLVIAGVLCVCIVTASCWGNSNPQDTLSPRGPVAHDQKALFYPIFWIAAVVFFGVEGLLLYTLYRFRHRAGTDTLPRQTHGNTRLEIGWTIAPTLLLAIIAIPTVATLYNLEPKKTATSMEVNVVGHQWWWEFQYPDSGVVTANELHIPVGRRINLHLASVDVIHAFHVPELAGQLDVVPNHNNEMWLQADSANTYLGQCTQFCGASHAFMRFRVVAQNQSDFDAWVAAQKVGAAVPTDPKAKAGYDLFTNISQPFNVIAPKIPRDPPTASCASCHMVNGDKTALGKVGPNLTHLQSRTTFAGASLEMTAENLAKWIRNPRDIKPDAIMPHMQLTDEQIDDLVAYLQTLK